MLLQHSPKLLSPASFHLHHQPHIAVPLVFVVYDQCIDLMLVENHHHPERNAQSPRDRAGRGRRLLVIAFRAQQQHLTDTRIRNAIGEIASLEQQLIGA
jgi:hypothetical protein